MSSFLDHIGAFIIGWAIGYLVVKAMLGTESKDE